MSHELRERLGEALRTDSDFDAFCQDFFPDVKRRFSAGMDRVAKTSLLLEVVPNHEAIARQLTRLMRKANAATVARGQRTARTTSTKSSDMTTPHGTAVPVELSPHADYNPLRHIPRPDVDAVALDRLRRAGIPVTLQAPDGYGKAWLVQHLLSRISEQDVMEGHSTVVVRFNVRTAASKFPESPEELWLSILRTMLKQLGVKHADALMARVSRFPGDGRLKFFRGFEEYVLTRSAERILLIFEEADYLHGAPIETSFFETLRVMAEDQNPQYRSLRLIVTIGAEAGFLEKTNHSSFFLLATPIILDGFTPKQLGTAARHYGLRGGRMGLQELHRLTAGHPFYSCLAMYEALCGKKSLAQALRKVDGRGGLFATSLQLLRGYVEREGLDATLRAILQSPRCSVPPDHYLKLYRKGLVIDASASEYRLRCPLFHDYFRGMYA